MYHDPNLQVGVEGNQMQRGMKRRLYASSNPSYHIPILQFKICPPLSEFTSFWPAYQAICPVAEGYVQRRPIYQLFWCLEYADPSPKHVADTQRICEQLGIAPLAHFE